MIGASLQSSLGQQVIIRSDAEKKELYIGNSERKGGEMIHNICDLIDNLPETEQSRDVLLALMGSRDSFARGWTIERLSKFREDLINESVIGEVKSMANNDQSQRNKSLAYDFMSRNPDVRLHDCLNIAQTP